MAKRSFQLTIECCAQCPAFSFTEDEDGETDYCVLEPEQEIALNPLEEIQDWCRHLPQEG